MTYTEDILDRIEQMASIYMPLSDMAVILDIPEVSLRTDIADKSTDAHKRYVRGKVSSKLKLHSREMELAFVGSPLALQNARENLLDMEDDE